MSQPRVIIADDHVLVLAGLKALLTPHYDVVGTVTNGKDLLRLAMELKPDAIVLDHSMPGLSGIEAASHLRKVLPETKLVFVTVHSSAVYLKEALRAGASAYLLKQSAVTELLLALTMALNGQRYITPIMEEEARNAGLSTRYSKKGVRLTNRERDVLRLVVEGRTAKEIATMLRISPRTSEYHKRQLMHKLSAHNSSDLVRIALRDHFVMED